VSSDFKVGADLGAKLDGIKQAAALDKQVDERLAKFTEL